MWQQYLNNLNKTIIFPAGFPVVPVASLLFVALFFLTTWSLVWKGIALWKAARNNDKRWFIVFLLVNTVGILELLYIYVFSKKGEKTDETDIVS